MRNMSFGLTPRQLVDGTKDITRRLGWTDLRPGERVRAVRKVMGLKAGERVDVLAEIKILSVRREVLSDITAEECRREGFPGLSPAEFVSMFCRSGGCRPGDRVTRIEFRRVDSAVGRIDQVASGDPDRGDSTRRAAVGQLAEGAGGLQAGEDLDGAGGALPDVVPGVGDEDSAGRLQASAARGAVGLFRGHHDRDCTSQMETRK
jgi:hypothetical protein